MRCGISDYIDASEVLELSLKVCLAFFAYIIVCLSKLGMDILTRNETYFNILKAIARISAIDKRWLILRPVNTEEPSVRHVSDIFKSPLGSFRCRCEIIPVCFIALVEGKKFLTPLTICLGHKPHIVFDVSWVV